MLRIGTMNPTYGLLIREYSAFQWPEMAEMLFLCFNLIRSESVLK